jgi:hypothetical protein
MMTAREKYPAAVAQLAAEAELRRREWAVTEERERGFARCRRIDAVADVIMSLESADELEEAVVTMALICYGMIGGMSTESNDRIRRVGEALLGIKWVRQGAEDMMGELAWGEEQR